jgi:hypothetical protein
MQDARMGRPGALIGSIRMNRGFCRLRRVAGSRKHSPVTSPRQRGAPRIGRFATEINVTRPPTPPPTCTDANPAPMAAWAVTVSQRPKGAQAIATTERSCLTGRWHPPRWQR